MGGRYLAASLARHKAIVVAVGFLVFSASNFTRTGAAQSAVTDETLERRIENRLAGFRGDVGVYVRHIPSGREAAVNADGVFPTASMIKVPILVTLFDAIENGRLDPNEKLVYEDSLYYPGEDMLGSFKAGESISLDKLMLLSISLSDNTASLWLQHLAGTGTEINRWLDANGYVHTRMNSRTPGRRDNWEQFGWGQTSPREMADLLVRIRSGDAVSPGASAEMYRILTRTYWDDEAVGEIPATIQVASKQGAVNASRSEVLLVNAPSGDYVLCIITNNQEDESWEETNEGFELIRSVSRTVWQYFEPDWPSLN